MFRLFPGLTGCSWPLLSSGTPFLAVGVRSPHLSSVLAQARLRMAGGCGRGGQEEGRGRGLLPQTGSLKGEEVLELPVWLDLTLMQGIGQGLVNAR